MWSVYIHMYVCTMYIYLWQSPQTLAAGKPQPDGVAQQKDTDFFVYHAANVLLLLIN